MRKFTSLSLALVIVIMTFSGCAFKKVGSGYVSSLEESAVSLGTISDNSVYTNDFAEISFTLPENWKFSSEEDLTVLMGGDRAALATDKQALFDLSKESPIYDMMASAENGMSTLTIYFDNTSRYERGNKLTADDYLNSLESEFEGVWEPAEKSEARLGNVDYTRLYVKYEGVDFFEEIFVRRVDEFIVCIRYMTFGENPPDYIGEYFS